MPPLDPPSCPRGTRGHTGKNWGLQLTLWCSNVAGSKTRCDYVILELKISISLESAGNVVSPEVWSLCLHLPRVNSGSLSKWPQSLRRESEIRGAILGTGGPTGGAGWGGAEGGALRLNTCHCHAILSQLSGKHFNLILQVRKQRLEKQHWNS